MLGKISFFKSSTHDWSSSTPILRYVIGISLIILVTTLMNYPLSYLTSVLALGYIAPGAKPLTIKQGVSFLGVLIVVNAIAFVFSTFFIDYPLVLMPLLALGILWLYYTSRLAIMVKLFAIISILIIPLLSLEGIAVGGFVAVSLIFNAFLAIGLTQLVFQIFPWSSADEEFIKQNNAESKSEKQRFVYALNILIILLPALLLFFIFKLSGGSLILIFIAILSLSPALANAKVGLVMIVANILGGVFAIIAYQFLTIVPLLSFMLLLILCVGFVFATNLFSKSKFAAIFGTGFSTFILILGSVTASDSDAGEKVWTRVVQISIAVIYVVVSFGILNYYEKSKKKKII